MVPTYIPSQDEGGKHTKTHYTRGESEKRCAMGCILSYLHTVQPGVSVYAVLMLNVW